ncbi:MAG: hypothetical protein WKF36_09270 [Candidatus Nitrosocosmicus sp.]
MLLALDFEIGGGDTNHIVKDTECAYFMLNPCSNYSCNLAYQSSIPPPNKAHSKAHNNE